MRSEVPMPSEARTLAIAERFHVLPWLVEDSPTDTVLRWISVMSVEGEVLEARAGLPSTEIVHFEDEDDEWASAV